MEVTQIDEVKQASLSQKVKTEKPKGKVCIYYPEMKCKLPRLCFKICRTCARASQYVQTNVVSSLFNRIKAMAILLLSHMGIQMSGSSAAGSGSAGGSGGFGGGGASGGGGGGGGS